MDLVGNRTLYSVFAAHAHAEPGRHWLSFEWEGGEVIRWSREKFLETVHRAANLLASHGIGAGDVVNLHLPNHPAYPQVILAASLLGAVVVPSSPACTAEELRYLLEHSEAKLILTEPKFLATVNAALAGLETRSVLLTRDAEEPRDDCYESALERQSPIAPPGRHEPAAVVQLIYTSGTTSRPKGVILTNANFVFAAETFQAASGLRADDHHLIALPMHHAAAQCHALWPSLIAGCSVTILSRFSASRFFEQAAGHGATMAALFAAPLRMLLNQPPRATDRGHALRNITFAQSLTPSQYDAWHERFGAPLQQLWGMTETCALPIMSPLTGDRRLRAMGRPVPGYEVLAVNGNAEPVAPGEPGELIVRGEPGRSLMKGYLKNPEATAQTLRQRNGETWLFTGDTVTCDEDGYFYFVDRGKDLIKRGGENISTGEVEFVIAGLPGVAEVCVLGLPDTMRDELIAAVIVLQSEAHLAAEEVRAHCAARLASYKVPERIVFVESLPRTSVGKMQKHLVRNLLAATP